MLLCRISIVRFVLAALACLSFFSSPGLFARTKDPVDSLNKAAAQLTKSDLRQSLDLLKAAHAQFADSTPALSKAKTFQLRAGLYRQQGLLKAALADYVLANQFLRKAKDSLQWNKNQVQIASLLTEDNQRDTALLLYHRAMAFFKEKNQAEELINCYNSLGSYYTEDKKLDSVAHYLALAQQQSVAKNYVYGIKKAHYNWGVYYRRKGEVKKAQSHFQQAFLIDSLAKDFYGMAAIQVQLAEMALEQKNILLAASHAREAYASAKKVPAFEWMERASGILITTSRLQNDLGMTIAWQDSALRDARLRRDKKAEYLTVFLDDFRLQQSQAAANETIFNRALRVSNEQLFILTVGTFILIVLAVLVIMVFINYQKQKHLSRELRAKNILIEKQVTELEIDNATKSKLLSIISHDLRNPMVNTRGILNLVNQDFIAPDMGKQLLRQLETQYMGTTSLLDNLLFWLRGQMNGKNMEYTRFSLKELLKNMFLELDSLVKQKGIHLHNTVDPDMLVWADQDMLRIVLRNLVSNAVKYTKAGGTITIAAMNREHDSLITVQDNGIGMTPETIEKVLARQYFTTVGTEREKGSGFGLMLCQDLIRRHKGHLAIDSQLGVGSIFSISLPLE